MIQNQVIIIRWLQQDSTMDEFIKKIGQTTLLSEDILVSMKKLLKTETIKKYSYILEEGQLYNRLYFIDKGFVRIFHIDDGIDKTTWLLREKDFVISVYSFFSQHPSYEYIETMDDCNLTYMSYDSLQHMYKEYSDFNALGRIITEKYYVQSEQRSILLRTATVEDRLSILLNTHPDIFAKIPAKYVASYIGCQPETLSRVRKML